MSDRIIIFDTTLRDGEQAPGFSMNLQEKIELARQLQRLKVDVIEAGFPISSPGDFESVKAVAQQIEGPQICGLARARNEDIDCCWEAV
ncbi:MAG TPA: 2-isopropylmalate synthase, partial [bacterium]|nr:2-isopropylmalate synthase [bacterium]